MRINEIIDAFKMFILACKINKVMCQWINRSCVLLSILTFIFVPYGVPLKMYYPVLSPKLELCLQNAWCKFCNPTSLKRKFGNIKILNNISSKFIILSYNNQIFKNCFVIIHYHLTKVSARINKCIIFEPDELSIDTIYLLYIMV